MFKPYGEVSENFLNKEKMFAFIRLVTFYSYLNNKYYINNGNQFSYFLTFL